MVAIKRAIELYEKKKAKERKQEYGKIYSRGKDNKKIDSGKFPKPIETRENVAGFVGVSRPTLSKTEEIVNAAE